MDLTKGLRYPAAILKWKINKIKRRKQFNFEKIVEPLMEEVTCATEGDLPGRPGERETAWEGIGEEVRINMPDEPVEIGDDYQDLIEELGLKERQKERIGEQIINDLPGGEQRGDEFYIILNVEEMRGPTEVPRERGAKGELDELVNTCWSAFEEAEDAEELETRIRGLSREHETPFEPEAIRYWEDNAGHPDWEQTFWHLYETGNLRSYYNSINLIEEYRYKSIESAKEFKKWLVKLN